MSRALRRVLVEIQESESGNCPNRGICVRAQVQCDQPSLFFLYLVICAQQVRTVYKCVPFVSTVPIITNNWPQLI